MAYGLTQSLDLELSSTQYATASDSATLSVTGNMTLEGWVKFESLPSSGTSYSLCSKYTTTSNQRSYEFDLLNTAGTYTIRLTISSTGAGATTTTKSVTWTPSTATWYHVAAVYTTAGTVDFYVDGTQQGTQQTGSQTSIFNSTAVLNIGSFNAGTGDYADGKFSLWRVWSTNRSQSDISSNMCNVLGSTTNLSAEWTLDNTYNDNSGNSNTLTASGSPVFSADVPSTCAVSTTIKTYNAATTATVKTVLNGTAIASRKTWNSIT